VLDERERESVGVFVAVETVRSALT